MQHWDCYIRQVQWTQLVAMPPNDHTNICLFNYSTTYPSNILIMSSLYRLDFSLFYGIFFFRNLNVDIVFEYSILPWAHKLSIAKLVECNHLAWRQIVWIAICVAKFTLYWFHSALWHIHSPHSHQFSYILLHCVHIMHPSTPLNQGIRNDIQNIPLRLCCHPFSTLCGFPLPTGFSWPRMFDSKGGLVSQTLHSHQIFPLQ